MALDCIMCGNPAGSREHVFPAAFGGRRKNKGIYCEDHNEGLGHHVKELMKALSYFNASLGVRSDHYDAPQPHQIAQPNGQRFQALHDNIEVAPPPPLSQTPAILGKEAVLAFASIPQRDRWITEQKKKGFEFLSAVTGESRTEYFPTAMSQRLEFGSDEFRCALAYVALTLLSHYFPDVSRLGALSSIKKCILGEELIGDRVWWVDPSRVTVPSDSSFPHVHSVVIEISGATGQATGLITLFKHLCLAVDLGVLPQGAEKRITILIDPLAQRPGLNKDVLEIPGGSPLNVPPREDGRKYLQQMVNQEKPNPVTEILREHRDIHMARLVEDLLPRLLAAQEMNTAERLHHVRMIIDEQGQRILNLLNRGIKMAVEGPLELPSLVIDALKLAIVEDSSTKHGMAERSMGYLILAKSAVMAEAIRHLDAGTMDEDTLQQLFGDGLGIAIATKPVTTAVINTTELRS
ncbi:hypothetical protein AO240_24010 [Pseudomonas sp. ICMP 460]|nr:hypothetical protein AO240_24010 [Pseudomonas sp. ICMP 460]